METAKKVRVRTNREQDKLVRDWLEKNQNHATLHRVSFTTLAAEIEKALGFPVSDKTVRGIADVENIAGYSALARFREARAARQAGKDRRANAATPVHAKPPVEAQSECVDCPVEAKLSEAALASIREVVDVSLRRYYISLADMMAMVRQAVREAVAGLNREMAAPRQLPFRDDGEDKPKAVEGVYRAGANAGIRQSFTSDPGAHNASA